MEKIITAIKSAFEEFDESEFRLDMLLDEIPDWDSMSSINFQLALQNTFGVKLSEDVVFTGEHTVSDVIEILREQGADI